MKYARQSVLGYKVIDYPGKLPADGLNNNEVN